MFYVVKHVEEEGAGLFKEFVGDRECKTLMADSLEFPNVTAEDVVIIMGGPMGVYEKQRYPFIDKELHFIRTCYSRNAKILGICLGAQLIAEALGGMVYRGQIKELGWYEITHTKEAKESSVFNIFPEKLKVFQWHQDTFLLPEDAKRLAFNENYKNQAFSIKDRIFGLQYHIEVTEEIIKDWFPEDYENLMDRNQLALLRDYAYEFFQRFIKL